MNVLIIDDEIGFCSQAKDYFSGRGVKLTTESCGDKAFATISETNPDIVVLDVDLGLRGTDGRGICAQLSRTSRYVQGSLGIIMISGHFIEPNDEVIGLEIGADNYLTKPFELDQLYARVVALGRRLGAQDSNSLDLGNQMTIHFDKREVLFQGTLVPLTRLEFNVIDYLAHPPDTVRTKSDMLENIWKTQHIEEGAIAKCISVIRKKLSPDTPELFIQTVYGVGYRLKGQEQ